MIAGSGGYAFLRGSLPERNGYAGLAGLGAPVEVLRDAHGVPHIFADTEADAAFALGWVHAQDRLVQMEAMRRLGAGRTAEVVGAQALGIDRYMRTLGLYRLAEAQVAQLSDDLRQVLLAYADGVNAWLQQHSGPLPPEFAALGIAPEPWTPADSLVWGRLMAMQLAENRHEELLRLALTDRLPAAKLDDLWPPYAADAPTTVEAAAARFRSAALGATAIDATALALLDADPVNARATRGASNIWIVAGTRTMTGKPMLANDPHLSFAMPGTWYLARLVTPDRQLVGATTPGVPLVILGHNGNLAWGLTTTTADVEDYVVERIAPGAPDHYLAPDGRQPFTTRTETIRVRDGSEETLVVRQTANGPVVSDVLRDNPLRGDAGRVLALAATYLAEDDRTPEAMFGFNRATTSADMRRAIADFAAPVQNIGWATTDGDIGLMVAGRIPIRRDGNGLIPRDGTTPAGDWTGWQPVAALPQVVNPTSGRIVNANNRLAPVGVPDHLFGRYDPGFRAARIVEALDVTPRHDLDSLAAIQVDTVSEMARTLLPMLLQALPEPAAAQPAVTRLRAWDGTMAADRAEPLIFAAWYNALHRILYAGALGELADRLSTDKPRFIAAALTGESGWCDAPSARPANPCGDAVAASLTSALAQIAVAHGDDMDAWRWGDAHPALFRHPLTRPVPPLGRLLDREIPVGGGLHTALRAAYWSRDADRPFAAIHGAGFRAVYDLADLARSRFVIATGQSGHPLSPHYGDMMERWRDGGSITLGQDRASLRAEASGRLLLVPLSQTR